MALPDEKPLEYHETPLGNYWLPTGTENDVVARKMRRGEVFDEKIVREARRHVRPGTLVLDVGACFGQMSLIFSEWAGPAGEVWSFEANDYIYKILLKNIAANGRSNVKPVFGAVFDKEGEVLSYPDPDFKRFSSWGSYGVSLEKGKGREVRTLTIDGLRLERPVSFLKVDVQGSDLHALRGAAETIRRHRMPVIFEFEEQFQAEFRTSWADYAAFVDSVGYKIRRVIDGHNYLITPRGPWWRFW